VIFHKTKGEKIKIKIKNQLFKQGRSERTKWSNARTWKEERHKQTFYVAKGR